MYNEPVKPLSAIHQREKPRGKNVTTRLISTKHIQANWTDHLPNVRPWIPMPTVSFFLGPEPINQK